MDIEGAERRALRGARQTLARFKPRIALEYRHADDSVYIPVDRGAQKRLQLVHTPEMRAVALFLPISAWIHYANLVGISITQAQNMNCETPISYVGCQHRRAEIYGY
jgi:hypothetical protein